MALEEDGDRKGNGEKWDVDSMGQGEAGQGSGCKQDRDGLVPDPRTRLGMRLSTTVSWGRWDRV